MKRCSREVVLQGQTLLKIQKPAGSILRAPGQAKVVWIEVRLMTDVRSIEQRQSKLSSSFRGMSGTNRAYGKYTAQGGVRGVRLFAWIFRVIKHMQTACLCACVWQSSQWFLNL